MGIRFACPACGHVLNIKSDLAGKRGICPKCQARVDIPLESTVSRPGHGSSPSGLKLTATAEGAAASPAPSAVLPDKGVEHAGASWTPAPKPVVHAAAPAPIAAAIPVPMPAVPLAAPAVADPISEAPHLLWYVAPPGTSNQYGPASAEMFRAWIHEGRVAADSMVWRQDWSAWLRAGDVLPQLGHAAPVVSLVPGEGPQAPAAALAGLGIDAMAAHGAEWSPSQPAGARPVIAGALASHQKKRPIANTTTVVIVLAILMLALIPVLWLVLRH
ncbi:MAG TPA: DUF4339 domain-containing protein [Pirellulales bacterium]|nr:DUF4339 domain-containing protein [Pirellulales bacterium]